MKPNSSSFSVGKVNPRLTIHFCCLPCIGDVTSDRDFAVSDQLKVMTATFVAATDQAGKCHIGKNKSITTFYENRIIVQINAMPLVITVAAEPSANVGLVLQTQKDILTAVEPLRQQLLQIERENAVNV
jgi:hypothetical protein